MLRAGFSKSCISPPVGAPLAGFVAREGVCEGIHDDLYSRALVLENDGIAIALVSLDVLALSGDFVSSVRGKIETRTGIKRDSIAIASTHTHAGPVTVKTFFNPEDSLDQAFMDLVAKSIEDSVAAAWENRQPSRVGVGCGRVEGIGVNRRTPDKKPVDEEIGIIKVEDLSGRPRAVLVNYSCHPTVLGSDNLLASGDFPYFAVERIEDELGDGSFAMFVNGTQGNISMGHSSELSAIGVITPGRTFEHAEELGKKLAKATLDALRQIETFDALKIDAEVASVPFPLKDLPAIPVAKKNLILADHELEALSSNGASIESMMKAKSKRLYASITDFYARETAVFEDGYLPVELQAVRIGDAVFLAVPAEVFVEIGIGIKQRAKHNVFIIGIANGYIGYLPTAAAYAQNGYEVVSSKVGPRSEELLYEEAIKLEQRLFAFEEETQKA
ncbi:MAG: neutral/alkaline non-lysosomal ceramidase N-terminal domain-containing protein [Pyrinomonadaceae bacterium]